MGPRYADLGQRGPSDHGPHLLGSMWSDGWGTCREGEVSRLSVRGLGDPPLELSVSILSSQRGHSSAQGKSDQQLNRPAVGGPGRPPLSALHILCPMGRWGTSPGGRRPPRTPGRPDRKDQRDLVCGEGPGTRESIQLQRVGGEEQCSRFHTEPPSIHM